MGGGAAGTPGKQTLTQQLDSQMVSAQATAAPRRADAPVPTADVAHALGGSSQPVDGAIADSVGAHTGVDVHGARVHTGPQANALAGAVGARALTVGNDIALGRGESAGDKQLVGHELGHVAQQRGGKIGALGPGHHGPSAMEVAPAKSPGEHEAHIAGEAAVSAGHNAAARSKAHAAAAGPKKIPFDDFSRMSKAEQLHAASTGQIHRWDTGQTLQEMVDSWPENYVVRMKNPPNVVLSQYGDNYRPEVYYNTEYGWSTYGGGNPGKFYLGGALVQGWENEDSWVTLNGIPKAQLPQPGPDSFDSASTRAEAKYFWRPNFTLDTASVTVGAPVAAFRSANAAAPTATAGDLGFDSANGNVFGADSGMGTNSPTTPVQVTYSQSVQKTVSETATGTFSGTTTYGTESSVGVEGSFGNKTGAATSPGGEDTWGLKGNLGRKWTNTEQEQAQRALASTYADMTTQTSSFTATYTVPGGVPAVVLVVPVTRKITTSFRVRDTDGAGLITSADMAGRTLTRVTEAHVPKGAVAVFGYDETYYNALRTHYAECRTLRQACNGLTGPDLEAKKLELRTKIERFNEANQPSAMRAAENARARLQSMTPAAGSPALAGASGISGDNIVQWNRELAEWRTFAGSV